MHAHIALDKNLWSVHDRSHPSSHPLSCTDCCIYFHYVFEHFIITVLSFVVGQKSKLRCSDIIIDTFKSPVIGHCMHQLAFISNIYTSFAASDDMLCSNGSPTSTSFHFPLCFFIALSKYLILFGYFYIPASLPVHMENNSMITGLPRIDTILIKSLRIQQHDEQSMMAQLRLGRMSCRVHQLRGSEYSNIII